MSPALRFVRTHWYPPVFHTMVAGVWWLARSSAFMRSGGEAALLIDLCLTAPILYMLCYARNQPLRVTAVRALAIACGGVWIATWLIRRPSRFCFRNWRRCAGSAWPSSASSKSACWSQRSGLLSRAAEQPRTSRRLAAHPLSRLDS